MSAWRKSAAVLLSLSMAFSPLSSAAVSAEGVIEETSYTTVTDQNGQTFYMPEDGTLDADSTGAGDPFTGEMGSDSEEVSLGTLGGEQQEAETEEGEIKDLGEISVSDLSDELSGMDSSIDSSDLPDSSSDSPEIGETQGGSVLSSDTIAAQTESDAVSDGPDTTPVLGAASESGEGTGELGLAELGDSGNQVRLKVGESQRIMIQCGGYDTDITLKADPSSDSCSLWLDHDWTGTSVGLTIHGNRAGICLITLLVVECGTDRVLNSATIFVTISPNNENLLTLNANRFNVRSGESVIIQAKCSNVSGNMQIGADWDNKSVLDADWDNGRNYGSGNSYYCHLKVTGRNAGTTTVTFYLLDESGHKVRTASCSVTVQQTPYVTVSQSSLTIDPGESATVQVHAGGVSTECVLNVCYDEKICGISWGDWSGDCLPLTIKGIRSGQSSFVISLMDKKTRLVFALARLNVYVRNKPKLTVGPSSMTMNVGDERQALITAEGYSGTPDIGGDYEDAVMDASFTESSSGLMVLNVKATAAGTGRIRLWMKDSAGNILATATVKVQVNPKGQLSVSSETVTVEENKEVTVTFTVDNVDPDTVFLGASCPSHGTSMCTWQWDPTGNFHGNKAYAYITGKSSGTYPVTVSMYDRSTKKCVDTVFMTIKVIPSTTWVRAAEHSLTIAGAKSHDLRISYGNVPDGSMIGFAFNKQGVLQGRWLGSADNSADLRLTGIGGGTTDVMICLLSDDEKTVYAEDHITVTVSQSTAYVVGDFSYRFVNSPSAFGNPTGFSLEAFQLMFGKTTLARDFFNQYGSGWGGDCFGMSLSSALIQRRDGITPEEFHSGATRPYDLSLWDCGYWYGSLKKVLDALQISQCSNFVDDMQHRIGTSQLGDLVAAVRNGLVQSTPMPTAIGYGTMVQDKDGNWVRGLHEVLAYAFVAGSGADSIYVYDPNYPMSGNRCIKFYKDRNGNYTSWSYDMNGYPAGTGQSYVYLDYMTYSDISRTWNSREHIIGASGSDSSDAGNGALLSAQGNTLWTSTYDFTVSSSLPGDDTIYAVVQDGVLTQAADGVRQFNIKDAPQGRGCLLSLPTGHFYKVKNSSTTGDLFKAVMANVELGAVVTTETDEIQFAVEDSTGTANVKMQPGTDAMYEVELQSSRAGDPQSTKIDGIGTNQEVSFELSDGQYSQTGALGAMTIQDGTIVGGHKIHAESSEGGEIFPNGDVPVADGKSQNFRITPKTGFYVRKITVDDQPVSDWQANADGKVSYSVSNVTADRSIRVEFAHDHSYGAWRTVAQPTAVSAGTMQRTCSICGAVERKSIAKLPATITLNAAGTLPLKTRQKFTGLKASLAAGDSIVSVVSGNSKVVKASLSGQTIVLKAGKKKGSTNITVTTAGGAAASLTIKVQKKAVTAKAISGIPGTLTLKRGQTFQLAPSVTPISTKYPVKYKSSKKKTASVSKRGLITAKKAGKSVITVACGKKKVKVKVTVVN